MRKEKILPYLNIIVKFVTFFNTCPIVYLPFPCKFETSVRYKSLIECNTDTTQRINLQLILRKSSKVTIASDNTGTLLAQKNPLTPFLSDVIFFSSVVILTTNG
jgi:hypothetical protein